MQTNPDVYHNIEMIDMMNCQYLSTINDEKPIKQDKSEKERMKREIKKRRTKTINFFFFLFLIFLMILLHKQVLPKYYYHIFLPP